MIDPRTPVIVGVGQVNGGSGVSEPVDLIATAVRRAKADTGSAVLPVDLIALTKIGTMRYRNAPRLVGQRTGYPEARTLQANHGGHTSQVILCHVAAEIALGHARAAVVAGGELGTLLRSGQARSDTRTPADDEDTPARPGEATVPFPDVALGDDLYQWICHPHEGALGIAEPIQMYPIMETALGAALGRTRDEHFAAISSLWSRASEVAMGNDFAADRRGYTAQEIATATATNRYVGYPYTKLMNSNQFVDQAAAILLCSAGVAMDLQISPDRWVFPWAGVTAHEPVVSERRHIHESAALAVVARQLGEMVGRPLREMDLVDLYVCFPFAVQTQARALGLELDAELTLTGGMRFAGGPWNNYGTHMIANVVSRLRANPEAMAVCSTNGGLATRFCVAAYAGHPSPEGFRFLPAPLSDPGPRRRLEVRPVGHARIEGYTIPHDRHNQPTHAVAACLLDDGARAWAKLDDPDELLEMLEIDPIGLGVQFSVDGSSRLLPAGRR